MKKFLFPLALLLSANASSELVDCVEFPTGEIISFEISADAQYFNCFKLVSVPPQTDVWVVMSADDDVSNKVTFFDLGPNGSPAAVAESVSDAKGNHAFGINSNDRELAFVVTPTSVFNANKSVSAFYFLKDGAAYLALEIDNLESTATSGSGGPGSGGNDGPGEPCTNPLSCKDDF